jgi:hypothetical protein
VDSRWLLDTSVLITARNSYYHPDFHPGFWDALIARHTSGHIHSVDRVRSELEKIEDDLFLWMKDSVPSSFFVATTDEAILSRYTDLQEWVNKSPQFTAAARRDFAGNADAWLIAAASSRGDTLVTCEAFSRDARKTVPIPNVCREFGIAYQNTFEMLRGIGERFVREAT